MGGGDEGSGLVDFLLEEGFHFQWVGEFQEGPAAERFQVVDRWNPVGFDRFLFGDGIFAAVAFYLDDEVEKIFGSVAIVDAHQEIGSVFAHFRAESVGDLKAEAMVFDVGDCLRVVFDDAAEFPFPGAIEDQIVQVAAVGAWGVAQGAAGGEVDDRGGADGGEGIEDGGDGPDA